MIDTLRRQNIDSILSKMDAQLEAYRSNEYSCLMNVDHSFQCGCMLFGALTKEMDRENLALSRPEWPFFGHSIISICETIRSMKSRDWYESRHSLHHCNITKPLKLIVDSTLSGVCGLRFAKQSPQEESAE